MLPNNPSSLIMSSPQVPVYQPFFLAAQLPHDLNFATTFRPPLFVRLITKSQRWGGKSVVEHYYYWRDTKGMWQERVVAVTAIMHAYPDEAQPSIGWERYFQYMRSYGYSIPTEQKSGTNAQNVSQDNTRSGPETRARAPTLEELWHQGVTPSLGQRGRLCQFSVLNSGAGAGPAGRPSLSAIQSSLPPPPPSLAPTTRFFLPDSQKFLPAPQIPLPVSQSSTSAIQRSLLGPRLSLPSTQPLLPDSQPSLLYTQSTLPASQPSSMATQTLPALQPSFQRGDPTILELLGLDFTPRPTVSSEVTPRPGQAGP
ncbi:hypothetical protein FRB90_005813 [Tulasnella sp. 427]|nr:hypothetical protein FRB90_005813 [Tulasnella sp. 427]